MKILCLFMLCNWQFISNITRGGFEVGLYQCSKCKSISLGSPNGPHYSERKVTCRGSQTENETHVYGEWDPRRHH